MKKKTITLLLFLGLFLVVVGCENQGVGGGRTDFNSLDERVGGLEEVELKIEGMTCSSCSLGVEGILESKDGISYAKVDFKEGKGVVRYDPDKIGPQEIADIVSETYPAEVVGN